MLWISLATVLSLSSSALPALANTNAIRGMNWADATGNSAPSRDLQPSGITSSMTSSQIANVATNIANAVKASGGTTIRMPISYGTTSDSTYWPKYQAAINAIVSAGCNVDLCFWLDQNGVLDNGVDSTANWQTMWDTVNGVYKTNSHVFYEPLNEPYGYSPSALNNVYAGFISRYAPTQWKCIFDGTSYAEGISNVGSDSRMNNQYLGFHTYHWFWSVSNVGSWNSYYNICSSNIGGAYASRTVITEMGVQTDRTVDFYWQWQQGTPQDVSYLTGTCAYVHDNSIGSMAWSGVNDGDSYHWFTASNNLVENNPGVANMFRYAWGVPSKWQQTIKNGIYYVQNRADSNMLDNLGVTTNGSNVSQSSSSGSANQKWDITCAAGYYTLTNLTSNLCLDTGGGTTNGSSCQQWANGTYVDNQHWSFTATDSGYYQMIDKASGICVDTGGLTANGAVMQLWYPSASYNQQWTFIATAPITNGNHTLTPQNATGSRLDAYASGTTNGTKVDIWQSNGGSNQNWSFTSLGGNVYQIQPSYYSALCLDVYGAATANGTTVDLWGCNGQTNQEWAANNVSGNIYTFAPQNATGSLLDIYQAGTANGTQVDIWQANGGANQNWAVN
jgi:hypothetical protein